MKVHLKNKRWPYILFVILIVAILISGGLTYYFFVKPEMVKSEEVTSTHHKTKEDIKRQ